MRTIKRWIRKLFCKNELRPGEILLLWKDVDNDVIGWNASAHNEDIVLIKLSGIIRERKTKKLEQITGIEKKGDDGEYLYPLEDEDDSPPPPY